MSRQRLSCGTGSRGYQGVSHLVERDQSCRNSPYLAPTCPKYIRVGEERSVCRTRFTHIAGNGNDGGTPRQLRDFDKPFVAAPTRRPQQRIHPSNPTPVAGSRGDHSSSANHTSMAGGVVSETDSDDGPASRPSGSVPPPMGPHLRMSSARIISECLANPGSPMTNLLSPVMGAGGNECLVQNSHLVRVSMIVAVHTIRKPLPHDPDHQPCGDPDTHRAQPLPCRRGILSWYHSSSSSGGDARRINHGPTVAPRPPASSQPSLAASPALAKVGSTG